MTRKHVPSSQPGARFNTLPNARFRTDAAVSGTLFIDERAGMQTISRAATVMTRRMLGKQFVIVRLPARLIRQYDWRNKKGAYPARAEAHEIAAEQLQRRL